MARFLVLRESDGFELLLERDQLVYVAALTELSAPFDAFGGCRQPDRGTIALEADHEIREEGSTIVWDRGELRGEVEPGAVFDVELCGARLVGRFRFDDRGPGLKVTRAGLMRRRPRVLKGLALLALLISAASLAGSMWVPGVHAHLLVLGVSDEEVFIGARGLSFSGEASALVAMGGEALPVILPSALEEARTREASVWRSIVVEIVARSRDRPKGSAEDPEEVGGFIFASTPEPILVVLASCLEERLRPHLRSQALEALKELGDGRCLKIFIQHLRDLSMAKPIVYAGFREAETELSDAFAALARFAAACPDQIDASAEPCFGEDGRLENPWPLVIDKFRESSSHGGPALTGPLEFRGRQVKVQQVIASLVAWLDARGAELPKQIEAPKQSSRP